MCYCVVAADFAVAGDTNPSEPFPAAAAERRGCDNRLQEDDVVAVVVADLRENSL